MSSLDRDFFFVYLKPRKVNMMLRIVLTYRPVVLPMRIPTAQRLVAIRMPTRMYEIFDRIDMFSVFVILISTIVLSEMSYGL